MKKFFLTAFMLSLSLLMLCGCNTTATDLNEDTGKVPDSGTVSGSGEAPPQPIPFERLEDAISFLKSGELNDYNADMDGFLSYFNETYRDMIELFMNDGFILNAEVNSEDFAVIALYLMPEQRYEDAGIIWNVTFKNQVYQIAVYHVKAECQGEENDMKQYEAQRFGYNTEFKTIQNGDKVIYSTSSMIMQYIDESHYCRIRGASEAEEIALLNAIHFEKVAIE